MEFTEDFTARMLLAAVVEPGSPITGQLIFRVGAARAVELIRYPDAPLPSTIEHTAGELWRRQAAARLSNRLAEQVVAQTETHGFRVVTPGNAGWPVALDDLGDHAPVALWAAGTPRY